MSPRTWVLISMCMLLVAGAAVPAVQVVRGFTSVPDEQFAARPHRLKAVVARQVAESRQEAADVNDTLYSAAHVEQVGPANQYQVSGLAWLFLKDGGERLCTWQATAEVHGNFVTLVDVDVHVTAK